MAATLAFDIGGTRIKAGLVRDGAVSALTAVPTVERSGTEDILARVIELGRDLMAGHGIAEIGLCVKGIVDPTQGVVRQVNETLMDWIDRPVSAIVAAELGAPVYMENDARMYALGEFVRGAGRQTCDMVCLTLGTGVGSGVAVGGRILRGRSGAGGILGGHITIQTNGPVCTCGNIGCLEALIGAAGLVRRAEAALASGCPSTLRGQVLTPDRIFAAAESDPVVRMVHEDFVSYLGAGIVSLIHTHDPGVVVLGGGMARAASRFLPAVRDYVRAHAWTVPARRVEVVQGQLGDAAALIGIAEFSRQPELLT